MTIFHILVLVLILVIWFKILKAREHVIKRCRLACEEAKLQFLDQSVAVISTRLKLGKSGLPEFHRTYQFEYSENGLDRYPAFVDLLNNRISAIRFTGQNGETIFHH